MTLIKSISGIRGTIGGGAGEGLNPLDIVKFTSAYATLIRKTCTVKSNKIVVGRDARISGEMVKNVVVGTLMGMGWDVVDIDLASTPTTELADTEEDIHNAEQIFLLLQKIHEYPQDHERKTIFIQRKIGNNPRKKIPG